VAQWASVSAIVAHFDLTSHGNDLAALRSELKQKLAAIHPDHNDGQFPSAEAKDAFSSISSALEYLDAQTSTTSLVPLQDIASLVVAIKQALQPTAADTQSAGRASYRDGVLRDVRSRLTLPRIGSTVFGGISAAILTFSGAIKDNPVFGSYLQNKAVVGALIMCFVYSGILFLMTWYWEHRERAHIDWLLTDTAIRDTLTRVVSKSSHGPTDDRAPVFRVSDYVSALRRRGHYGQHSYYPDNAMSVLLDRLRVLLLLPRHLTSATLGNLAKQQLEELERRGIVKKVAERRLDAIFEVTPDALDDLRRDDRWMA